MIYATSDFTIPLVDLLPRVVFLEKTWLEEICWYCTGSSAMLRCRNTHVPMFPENILGGEALLSSLQLSAADRLVCAKHIDKIFLCFIEL